MAELTIRPEEIRDALENFVQSYKPDAASREPSIIATTGVTKAGSLVNVWRVHSSATVPAEISGFQAMRPKTYQLAWLKMEPDQSASVPILATPAIPLMA